MTKKNFLLLSLEEEKAKKIANVMGNKSCTKILDLLAEKDYTESEIAKKLNLPISTVHYNIEQLLEAKLVDWENYHYSEKGKEVKHYALANKYIIIAPKEEKEGFMEKLKGIFPAFGLSVIGAVGIWFLSSFQSGSSDMLMAKSQIANDVVADEMYRAGAEAAPLMLEVAEPVIENLFWQQPAVWFFIGAIFALFCVLLWSWIRKKK